MSRRPSVSRMRENRTYGLKGGWGNGPAGTAPLTTNGDRPGGGQALMKESAVRPQPVAIGVARVHP